MVSQLGYYDSVRYDCLPSIPATGGNLLELGGGTGATALELKATGKVDRVGVVDLLGKDDQRSTLDFCYSGDLNDLAFLSSVCSREGPFDLVLALDVLEHLVDPWAVVRQVHAALKPNGVFVASIPNVRNFHAVVPLVLFNRWTLADDGILDRTHLRFFVRSTAIGLVTGTGLTLESIRACPTNHKLIHLFRKFTFGLFNSFTDRNYVLVARNLHSLTPESR